MIMQLSNLPADIEVLEKIRIAEVMTLNPASIKYSMPLLQAAQFITSGYHHSALVLDDINHLQGILTTQDIKRLLSAPVGDRPIEELTVENICTSQVLCTFADESLAEALKRMATRDLRQMPVVDRNQPKRVIGMVDRLAITTAYNTALTKRAIAARMTAIKPIAVIAANIAPSITANIPPVVANAVAITTNNDNGNGHHNEDYQQNKNSSSTSDKSSSSNNAGDKDNNLDNNLKSNSNNNSNKELVP
jgi:signal-transduction protein with cAMP-binding, CBS, and nucleotidyltransferase domain